MAPSEIYNEDISVTSKERMINLREPNLEMDPLKKDFMSGRRIMLLGFTIAIVSVLTWLGILTFYHPQPYTAISMRDVNHLTNFSQDGRSFATLLMRDSEKVAHLYWSRDTGQTCTEVDSFKLNKNLYYYDYDIYLSDSKTLIVGTDSIYRYSLN